MIFFYGAVLFLYIVVLYVSLRYREKGSYNKRNFFEGMGLCIYKKFYGRSPFYSKKAERHLEMLHPGTPAGEKKRKNYFCNSYVDKFYIRKISLVLLIIFIGEVFAIFLCLNSQSGGALTDGKYIQRNTYGEGSIEADLQAEIESGEGKNHQDFLLIVNERKYEKDEIKKLAAEVSDILPDLMLNQNISLEEVRDKLNLVNKVEGYPFQISWESDNYELVYTDGTINNEHVKENGEVVNLTATFIYDDYREEHTYAIRICSPVYSAEELIKRKVYEEIARREELYGKEPHMELPDMVESRAIRWTEKKEDSSGYLFLLACIAAISIYFLQDRDLYKKAEQRNRQMLLDYPGIISKLTLYMGAGMTIRNAFCKIACDYENEKNHEKRYVYEEMLITCHELNNGISETSAYENFGKRCRLPQYTKLSNILIQNLKKGSNSILSVLRQEVVTAFEERKSTAKKLGEEAGTKLLFPMMLMLSIVMILIIVPAYFSFSI